MIKINNGKGTQQTSDYTYDSQFVMFDFIHLVLNAAGAVLFNYFVQFTDNYVFPEG